MDIDETGRVARLHEAKAESLREQAAAYQRIGLAPQAVDCYRAAADSYRAAAEVCEAQAEHMLAALAAKTASSGEAIANS